MLVVITCFFNPNRSEERIGCYNVFHNNLKRVGIPVYTLELVFGDQPFQLTEDDATCLKQLRCTDLMFQKERALNLLLNDLPDDYDEVIWMDCDLFFFEDSWPSRVSEALRDYQVIQPYTYSVALPRAEFYNPDEFQTIFYNCYGSGRIKRSYAYYHNHRHQFSNFHHGHVGYVWAARRDFLERHKFYDPIISGAGDLFMLMAFSGNFGWLDYPLEIRNYPAKATLHFLDWGFPVYEETKGRIGYTSDLVLHVWHGEIEKRNYLEASRYLQTYQFDPEADLAVADNGVWRWNSPKYELHEGIRKMFTTQG